MRKHWIFYDIKESSYQKLEGMRGDPQAYQELQQAPFSRLLLTARVMAQVSVLHRLCQLYNLGCLNRPVSDVNIENIKL
jgi:hypothetical protein